MIAQLYELYKNQSMLPGSEVKLVDPENKLADLIEACYLRSELNRVDGC